jgi:hypothetical protein
MKYLKTFGLATLAASLMALCIAGSASATVITGEGGKVLPAGSFSESVNQGNIILDAAIGNLECKKSVFAGKSTNEGGATETVKGNVETFTFSECNTTKLVVLTKGTTEAHTAEGEANNNGLVTSTGVEITVEFNGFHCIFKTNNTAFGTETGSANTGGASVIDLASTVPRSGGRSGAFCGTTGTLTGTYKNVTPGIVNVD